MLFEAQFWLIGTIWERGAVLNELRWLLPLAVAPIVGSFLGVLIARLPEHRPVAWVRSCCDSCATPLGPAELVPIASFLALRGRCRHCGSGIPAYHLVVEIAALLVAGWAVAVDYDDTIVWADCTLGWTLLALAWVDWRHMRLPDVLTLPLIVAGLCVTALWRPEELTWHAVGAIAGYSTFRLIALGYRWWRGIDGLGEGDAKLMAAAGAWLGLAALPYVALGAASSGIVLILATGLAGRQVSARTAIPFGPALSASIWICWLYLRGWLV